jgi:NADP-dependent aldehyde dehydrogenase
LKEAADKAGKPVYLEMSSVNPVFILPGALEERMDDVVSEFTTSCALGAGQFCTNPGLIVVMEGELSETFLEGASARFQEIPAGVLLGASGPSGIADAIKVLQEHGSQLVTGGNEVEGSGYSFENTLLRVSGDDFLANPDELQTEAFGTTALLVFAKDIAQMAEIAASLEGNLTGTIYSDTGGSDDALYDQLEPALRSKVGRLLNDKMPTGVAVVPSMNHGGPYPATGHPGFTAVGIPASMLRFGALHCYDNVRPHRLPPELQDEKPVEGMWRLADGTWIQKDL